MDLQSHPSPDPDPDPEKASIVSKMKAAPQLKLLTSPTSPNLKRKRQEAQLRSRAELQREQDEEQRLQALRKAQQKASELTARNGRSLQVNKYPSRGKLPSSVRTFSVATGNQKGRERERERGKEKERQREIGNDKSSSLLNRQVKLNPSTSTSTSTAKPFPASEAQQDSIPIKPIKPIPPTNFYKSKSTPADSPSPPPPTRNKRPPLPPKRDITRRKARRISPLPENDDDHDAWNETPVEENFRREESPVNKLHESASQMHPLTDPAPVPQNGISNPLELNPGHQSRTSDGDERHKRLFHHLHEKTSIRHSIQPAPRPQSKASDGITNPKPSTSNLQPPSTALESSYTPPKKKKYKSATQPRQRGPRAMTRSESAKFSGSRASSPLGKEEMQIEREDGREQKGKRGPRKRGEEEDGNDEDGNDGKREGSSREAGRKKVVVQEKEKGKGKGRKDFAERKEAKSVGAQGQVDKGAAKLRSSKVDSNLEIDGKRKASGVGKREMSIPSRKEQINTSTRSGKSSIRNPEANLVDPINPTNISNSKPTTSKDPTSTEAERASESKKGETGHIPMTKHGESHQARASKRKDEGMQEESIVLDSMPGAFGEDDEGENLLVDVNLNCHQNHPPDHKLLPQQRDEDRDQHKTLDLDFSRNAEQDTAQTQNQPRKSSTAAAANDRAEEKEGGTPEAQIAPDADDAQASSEFDSGSENEEDYSQFVAEDSMDPLDLLPEFKKSLRSRSSSRIGIERELEGASRSGARGRGRGKGLGNERDEKTCRRKENQRGETSRKRPLPRQDPDKKSKNQGEQDRARENQEKVLNPNQAKNPDSKTTSNEEAIEKIPESEVSNDENQEEQEKDEDRIQKSQSLSLSSSISISAASRGKSPIESSSDTPRSDSELLPIPRSRNELSGQSEARNKTKVSATEKEGTNFTFSNQPRWEEIPFLRFDAHQLRLVPESLSSSSSSSEILEMDRNHLARSKAYEDAHWIRKEIPDPIPSLEISAKSWRFGTEPPSRTELMKEAKGPAGGRDLMGRENGKRERGNGRRKLVGWKWNENEERDQTLPGNESQENDDDLEWKDEISRS